MNLAEVREYMWAARETASGEAEKSRDSYLTLDRLHGLYAELESAEKLLADQILAEWVLSDDVVVRFDAKVLIDDLKIRTAVHALRELAQRLERGQTPMERDELELVRGTIVRLDAP